MSSFMSIHAMAAAVGSGLESLSKKIDASTGVVNPQIGDRVKLMDTVPDRLLGLDWYYIGDKRDGDAVVCATNGDFLYIRKHTMILETAECYNQAADCRLRFEAAVSEELIPIGGLPQSGVGRAGAVPDPWGLAAVRPEGQAAFIPKTTSHQSRAT